MSLTDAQFEVFQLLTQRTLLVLDTEYCRDPGGEGDRLISLAIVPIVRGKRASSRDVFYREMNPGVPIDAGSAAVHGFTDDSVRRKRPFAAHAADILAALRVDGAVLVQHTGSDIRVLRSELERLDAARAAGTTPATVGLGDLPELPIIDTSTLPRLLNLPGIKSRGLVSLETLCGLTSVVNTRPHDARGDATATADALLALLVHAAAHTGYTSLDQILLDHERGTTLQPRLPQYVRRRDPDVVLPPEHLTAHDQPLTHAGTPEERRAWLRRAADCIELRCPHLREEADLAAEHNGRDLIDPLMAMLPALTEPGQPGTLLGAALALVAPSDPTAPAALAHTRSLKWWAVQRPHVRASAACGDKKGSACPSCRDGDGCPRDVLYQAVARISTLAEQGRLTRVDVRDRLFGARPDRRINKWPRLHPEVAAWMTWFVITYRDESNKPIAGAAELMQAMDQDLHLAEPRLALLACEFLLSSAGLQAAETVARQILSHRTTDEAYTELASWLVWQQQAIGRTRRETRRKIGSHPRMARPEGRVNPNPYLP